MSSSIRFGSVTSLFMAFIIILKVSPGSSAPLTSTHGVVVSLGEEPYSRNPVAQYFAELRDEVGEPLLRIQPSSPLSSLESSFSALSVARFTSCRPLNSLRVSATRPSSGASRRSTSPSRDSRRGRASAP
ncbi:MAG: hypothetical protein MZV64_37075 [Ignavibacteriales bacterium]|nr:hypothetical protein [Ignavibacteriales bacterium]